MDAFSVAVIVLALAAGAVAKGATGMGLPLIALPVLTSFLGLPHAVGLMVVPILATNIWQTWRLRHARGDPGLSFLPAFLLGGGAGVVAGTWILSTVPERMLITALGAILIGYVILRLARPGLVVGSTQAKQAGAAVGFGAGVLHGATGISAPIGVTFMHWMSLPRDTHVFAVSAMFLVFALVQLPAMTAAGLMQVSWIVEGLLALLPIFAFMPLGRLLGERLSKAAFDRLILIFLGGMGLKMLAGL